MKRIVLPFLMALVMLAVTACGSSAPTMDSATQVPVVRSGSSQSSASGGATEVDITLADNTIDSTLTTFKAGAAYTFVIKNTGSHFHDFNIAPPVSVAGSLDAALSQALLVVTRDQLAPGGTATVTYTFPDSAVSAPLEFSCLIPRHYEDGMRLAITVTK